MHREVRNNMADGRDPGRRKIRRPEKRKWEPHNCLFEEEALSRQAR